jgi:hypothetical protein
LLLPQAASLVSSNLTNLAFLVPHLLLYLNQSSFRPGRICFQHLEIDSPQLRNARRGNLLGELVDIEVSGILHRHCQTAGPGEAYIEMPAPDNIYEHDVDFTTLALQYPDFAKRYVPLLSMDARCCGVDVLTFFGPCYPAWLWPKRSANRVRFERP